MIATGVTLVLYLLPSYNSSHHSVVIATGVTLVLYLLPSYNSSHHSVVIATGVTLVLYLLPSYNSSHHSVVIATGVTLVLYLLPSYNSSHHSVVIATGVTLVLYLLPSYNSSHHSVVIATCTMYTFLGLHRAVLSLFIMCMHNLPRMMQTRNVGLFFMALFLTHGEVQLLSLERNRLYSSADLPSCWESYTCITRKKRNDEFQLNMAYSSLSVT